MRNFDRYPIDSQAIIIENKTTYRILIKNFSRMGVALISKKSHPLKSFISLLYQNENHQFIQMKCYIKHRRQLHDGCYLIGLQFIGIEIKFNHAS